MKKLFLSIMLAMVLSASCLIPAKNVQAATETIGLTPVASVSIEQSKNNKEKFDVVKAKTDLMEKYKDKLNKKRTLSPEEIDNQFNVMLVEGKTEEEIDAFAKENGLIKLEQPQSNDDIMMMSAPSDAICQNISIYFDQYTGQWVVRGSGSWSNKNFVTDANVFICTSTNIGSYDAVGITFFNTNSSYSSSVVSSSAQFYDGHQRQVTSYSPSQGDGKLGVAFYIQDTLYLNSPTGDKDPSMVGQYFNVNMRYDSNFSKYDGTARMFYIHTWDKARIDSIGFSGDNAKSFGVSASISSQEKSFQIFSNGDCKF